MEKTDRENLQEQLDECTWKDLVPHFARGNIIKVSTSLDILETAIDVANDNAVKVKLLLEEKKLDHATDEDLKAWNETPEKRFKMLVVAPFILIQELLDS